MSCEHQNDDGQVAKVVDDPYLPANTWEPVITSASLAALQEDLQELAPYDCVHGYFTHDQLQRSYRGCDEDTACAASMQPSGCEKVLSPKHETSSVLSAASNTVEQHRDKDASTAPPSTSSASMQPSRCDKELTPKHESSSVLWAASIAFEQQCDKGTSTASSSTLSSSVQPFVCEDAFEKDSSASVQSRSKPKPPAKIHTKRFAKKFASAIRRDSASSSAIPEADSAAGVPEEPDEQPDELFGFDTHMRYLSSEDEVSSAAELCSDSDHNASSSQTKPGCDLTPAELAYYERAFAVQCEMWSSNASL